ncbi:MULTISPECIES: hypothetical protein [Methylobacterium]|uniref:Uncharacterized protein n=1 Tax=Methylobacterium longum TaxID=767694 RepID=A0ABT8AUA5_9HYPH|nr:MULTISPECIES: hypothetical protein [Methylobacterium]MCJ2100757.1 hypothetical protein [Methylobacterium sp. E-046]MDN3572924.1 hypothetical protein [Methylobacterium longum]GJE09949.1 hypothetical protein FOHLNKBM_0977 [Methylobacterium longum]
MLDVIARLLLSAGLMVGTTYLPMLSQTVTALPAGAQASAMPPRACSAKPAALGARALACLG